MKKIFSASITPFVEDGSAVDTRSLERLIAFDIGHGIDGFFFFGSMGEWSLLSKEMRRMILETAVKAIDGKAEILAGVNAPGFAGIVENMEAYSIYPIDAYVVQFPGGFANPRDPVAFLHTLADISDKPIYLYYLPQVNGVRLSKEQFASLFSHPKVIGVKNSSSDQKTRKELLILKRSMDFRLFEGQEWTVDESLALGCDGALVGMAPLGAKLFKRIASAVDLRKLEEAFELQKTMIEIFDGVYGPSLNTVWIGQKYALTLLGIFSSFTTLVPAETRISEEDKRRVEACIERYKRFLM